MRSSMAGVVAAGDPQTAEAGARLLAAGGNAFDAAVAAAFAAFVCELPLCSPLGGGVLVARDRGGGLHAVDMFARTPGLGGRPSELEFEHVVVDFGAATQVFHVGRGSAAVPLALPGLLETHRRWGRLPLSEVVAPAVELGRTGFVLGPGIAYVFELLSPIVCRTDECRRLFSDGAELAQAGARLQNPELADALERIARRPETVQELYAALARELGPARGGLIAHEDVAAVAIADGRPLEVEHRGRRVVSMPAPSTGGVLVLLGLRLLEGVGELTFLSPAHVDRLLTTQHTLLRVRGGDFDQRCRDDAWVRGLLEPDSIAELGAAGPDNLLGSTTHISVLDGEGGAVALTLTNGEGSGVVLSGTGMVVNNLLGEEDIHPRGFHRDPPGAPLVTMMAPTLVLGADQTLALGSGGSNRLRNAILAVLAHTLDHERGLAEAVEAPRVHLELVPGAPDKPPGRRVAFERPGLPRETLEALRAVPHVEFSATNMYFGGVHVAACVRGGFNGVGDARRGGSVRVPSSANRP